jgi:AcrR family transcriptional regulator
MGFQVTYARIMATQDRPRGIELREGLVAAATRILGRDGDPSAITIRSVAAEAGVSQPAVYLHFQSRDELVYEVVFRQFGIHEAALDEELADISSPMERITRRGEDYIEFALENPGLFHILWSGNGQERNPDRFEGLDDLASTGPGALVDDVRAAMEAGQITPRDPVTTAIVLWMGVHGLASLLIALPGFPWPPRTKLVRAMLDSQEAAMLAPSRPGTGW